MKFTAKGSGQKMSINRGGLLASIFLATSVLSASSFINLGCGWAIQPGGITCDPDGGDCANFPSCCEDAGPGIAPESLRCEDKGGACMDLGPAYFTSKAVLLWVGDELEAPPCPERAASEYYTGYGELVVDVQCEECKCSEPSCILPNAIGTDKLLGCASGVSDNYAAPLDWDGSCYSPAVLPAGSFASFALPTAEVSPCTPLIKDIGAPSAMAPRSNVVFGGAGFKAYAKVCQGDIIGECESSAQTCVQNASPPPPEFRYCVMYTASVDEAKLPECPSVFPERHVFYKGVEGKRECSPCQCSEPMDGQCIARFSAYQDPACSDNPLPFFKDVGGPQCLTAMNWPLGAISASWAINAPGKCKPMGGEAVGEIKPVDPSVFCCQPLPDPSSKPSIE